MWPITNRHLLIISSSSLSSAGPWLKYRGHLDNISNNMFITYVRGMWEAYRMFYPSLIRSGRGLGTRLALSIPESSGLSLAIDKALIPPPPPPPPTHTPIL